MPLDLSAFALTEATMHLIRWSNRQQIFLARDSLRVGWVAQFRDGETPFVQPAIDAVLQRKRLDGRRSKPV